MNLPIKKSLTALVLCAGLTLASNQGPSLSQQSDPYVVMETSKGPIVIRVYLNMVPNTSRNFLDLVQRGFYDGKSFHRVETWCIQGGDPAGNGTGNFVDPATGNTRFLNLEINRALHHNAAGVVAMARGRDLNSASCQFYILKTSMPQLDGKYAIFGGVVKGIETVKAIRPGDNILRASIAGGGGSGSSAGSGGPPPNGPSGF